MSNAHGSPSEGAECMSCMCDMDSSNYVEYRSSESSLWLVSKFCSDCCSHLQKIQFNQYEERLKKTTCQAEMRRLVEGGPPINLFDKTALPCDDDPSNSRGEVHSLWFSSDGQEHSAKLEGSLEGDARANFIVEIGKFYITTMPDEEEKA